MADLTCHNITCRSLQDLLLFKQVEHVLISLNNVFHEGAKSLGRCDITPS